MNNKEQQEFQMILQQKQQWIQKAIKNIQRNDNESAIKCINIDAGLNIKLTELLKDK